MQIHTPCFRVAAYLAAALLAPVGQLAYSQTDSAPVETDQEAILLSPFEVTTNKDVGYMAENSVSATRIDVSIKEIPFTINVVTSELLGDINATGITDTIRYTPGIDIGRGEEGFIIRGFESPRSFEDGLPKANVNRDFQTTDTYRFERVEVLKGPSAILFGVTQPGGLVNVVAKKPNFTKELKGHVGYTYEETGRHRIVGDVQRKLFTIGAVDTAFRFIAAYDEDPHYVDYYNTRTTTLNPQFSLRTKGGLLFRISYDSFYKDGGGLYTPARVFSQVVGTTPARTPWTSAGTADFLGDDRAFPQYFFMNTRATQQHESWANNLKATLEYAVNSDFYLRAAFSRQEGEQTRFRPEFQGGLNAAGVLQASRIVERPGILSVRSRWENDQRWTDADIARFESTYKFKTGSVEHNLLAGYDYSKESATRIGFRSNTNIDWNIETDYANIRTILAPPPLSTLTVAATNTVATTTTKAFFVVDQAKLFNDRLFVMVGARKDEYETTQINGLNAPTLPSGAPNPSYRQDLSGDAVSPQAGLSFKLTENINLFALYSKSYVPASGFSLEPIPTTGTYTPGEIPNLANYPALNAQTFTARALDSETGEGTEFGVKASFFEEKVSITASYFDIEQNGVVTNLVPGGQIGIDPRAPDNRFANVRVNGGINTSKGFDLNLFLTPRPEWQIIAGYAYVDTLVVSNPANPTQVGLPNQEVPKNAFKLWTKYKFAKNNFGQFAIFGGLQYLDDSRVPAFSTTLPVLPGYTRYDAGASFTKKIGAIEYQVTANLENISDERYYPQLLAVGRPRTLTLKLDARF